MRLITLLFLLCSGLFGQGGRISTISYPKNYMTTFASVTTVTITGATHQLNSKALLVACYDNATPAAQIPLTGLTINGSTYDIVATWSGSKTGYCVVNATGADTVTPAAIGAAPASALPLKQDCAAVATGELNLKCLGAIADGASHPLSTRYATLAAARVDFPFVTALTQQIDWAVLQQCFNAVATAGGGTCAAPGGPYYVTDPLVIGGAGNPVNGVGLKALRPTRATDPASTIVYHGALLTDQPVVLIRQARNGFFENVSINANGLAQSALQLLHVAGVDTNIVNGWTFGGSGCAFHGGRDYNVMLGALSGGGQWGDTSGNTFIGCHFESSPSDLQGYPAKAFIYQNSANTFGTQILNSVMYGDQGAYYHTVDPILFPQTQSYPACLVEGVSGGLVVNGGVFGGSGKASFCVHAVPGYYPPGLAVNNIESQDSHLADIDTSMGDKFALLPISFTNVHYSDPYLAAGGNAVDINIPLGWTDVSFTSIVSAKPINVGTNGYYISTRAVTFPSGDGFIGNTQRLNGTWRLGSVEHTAVDGVDTSTLSGIARWTAGVPSAGSPTTVATGRLISLSAPEGTALCSTPCTVTPPTPAAGLEFCVRQANNVATPIIVAGLTGVSYELTDRTGYATAKQNLISTGAATDQICILGIDSTHYATASSTGTWTPTSNSNLLTQSQALNLAAWTKVNSAAIVTADTTAPDGSSTAIKFTEDSANNLHQAYQSLTVSAQVYTVSAYMKAGSRTKGRLRFDSGTNIGCNYDLSSGTMLFCGAGHTGTITSVGNGWYRVTTTATATAATWYIDLETLIADTQGSYAGDGASGIYVWGVQLNTGAAALPYTPTTTTAIP